MTHDKTSAARVGRARQRLAAEGGRRMDLRLSPEANAAATRICSLTGESTTALINRLLIKTAEQIDP